MSAGLSLTGLTVSYGPRTVLNELSVDLTPGRVHGLIGPNGAGKSTLVKAVLGLIAYEGSVTVSGRSLASMNPRQRARHLAYLAQETSSPADFTGRQLVEMGRYARQSRFAAMSSADERAVDAALRLTGADAWAQPTGSRHQRRGASAHRPGQSTGSGGSGAGSRRTDLGVGHVTRDGRALSAAPLARRRSGEQARRSRPA